jgi:methylated-DNA-[protein]-cysteine S-methyltransferase
LRIADGLLVCFVYFVVPFRLAIESFRVVNVVRGGWISKGGNQMNAEFCMPLDSPIGRLLLAGTPAALTALEFLRHKPAPPHLASLPVREEPFREAVRQLKAYFDGRLQDFDLPLALTGTPFQMSVWDALRRIPYGEVITYGELARQVDRPAAFRPPGPPAAAIPSPSSSLPPGGGSGDLHGFAAGLDVRQLLQLGSWPIKRRTEHRTLNIERPT